MSRIAIAARAGFLALLGAGLLVPLVALLARAGAEGRGLGLLDPVTLEVAGLSAGQAMLSTAIAVALGYPLGLALGRAERPRATLAVLNVPFGIPTVVVAAALVQWLGRRGILADLGLETDWLYSLRAVVGAHVLLNAPLVAIAVARARSDVPREAWEAARTLGAGRVARFRALHWPETRAALGASAAQVFSLCVMSFALVLLLGGGPPVETLETAIFLRVRQSLLDVPSALGCALWQLALTLAPWALLLGANVRAGARSARELETGRRPPRGARAADLALMLAAFAFTAPYLVLLTSASLARLSDAAFWSEIADPLRMSFVLAAGSATLALAGALLALAGERRGGGGWLAALATLPAGVSSLVLALGMWLAYARWVDPFEGSAAAIVVIQGVGLLPLAYRVLQPLRATLRPGPIEVARTLGAGPLRAFVAAELPRWRGPLAATWGMAAGAALGEVAAVSFFYSERVMPLPVVLSRWLSSYRFEDAQALALLLGALAGGMIFSMGWLGARGVRSDG